MIDLNDYLINIKQTMKLELYLALDGEDVLTVLKQALKLCTRNPSQYNLEALLTN